MHVGKGVKSMNSISNHSTITSNDVVSELNTSLPPPQPTLHLSRAVQKPNSSRTSRSETLCTHLAAVSVKKRPFKDVGNSVRLPIPSSFVDDLLFRLNNDNSDDDSAAKESRSPKRSKECLRQKLQLCKSELQSFPPKESADVKADDHPSDTVGSAHVVDKGSKMNPKKQEAARIINDEPKGNETFVSEDASVNCNELFHENAESNCLGKASTDVLSMKPLALNGWGQGADTNSEDHPGKIAELHDSTKHTKIARRTKRVAPLKPDNRRVEQLGCGNDKKVDVSGHDQPSDAAESISIEISATAEQRIERVALSTSDDLVVDMEINGDCIQFCTISEQVQNEAMKTEKATKAVRKTRRAAHSPLIIEPLASIEERRNEDATLNGKACPCDDVEVIQLDPVRTKVTRKTKRSTRPKNDESVDQDEANGWKLDLSQSDSAIERALLQRLRKLESITDHYEEQTDVIRRKLKKHRRTMWLKQQKPLDATKNKAMLGYFLPDVQELVQLDDALSSGIGIPPPSKTEIRRVQGNLFGKRKSTTTSRQPTLTQMNRETKDPSDDQDIPMKLSNVGDVIENINIVDLLMDESDCSLGCPPDVLSNAEVLDGGDETDRAAMLSTRPNLTVPSPPPKVHRVEICQDPMVAVDDSSGTVPVNQYAGASSSIWDAFRYGMYDSSWDQWWMDTTCGDDHAAVKHLLELMDQSISSPRRLPIKTLDTMQSPSCLSTRARTLAGTLVEKVNSNALLGPAIEQLNPDWEENIYFALGQKNARDVRNALCNVRTTQQMLQRLKNDILSNLDRQEMLLSVYEDSLQTSWSRFDARNDASSPGGIGTPLSPAHVKSAALSLPSPASVPSGRFLCDALVEPKSTPSVASRVSSPMGSTGPL